MAIFAIFAVGTLVFVFVEMIDVTALFDGLRWACPMS